MRFGLAQGPQASKSGPDEASLMILLALALKQTASASFETVVKSTFPVAFFFRYHGA